MAMLANFTPEDITWTHVGINGTLKSGEIEEYPDGRANHILNNYGRRGIVRYRLNDDDEAIRAKSMSLYKRFWMTQITTFNQQNEAKKNENKPYTYPTDVLRDKAEEFGLDLVAPWRMQTKTDSAQVSELKAENKELKNQIAALSENQAEMLKVLKELNKKPARPVVIDTADLIKKFITLDKAKFHDWIIKNSEEIEDWPTMVKERMCEKYSSLYPKAEEFPEVLLDYVTE